MKGEQVMGQTVTITSANSAANGITANPVTNGQQNVVVLGFTVAVSGGTQNFNQFVLGCNTQNYINAKLYRATTGSTSFSGAQQIATLAQPNSYMSFTGISETITNTSRTYFLVVDISEPSYVSLPTNIQFSIAQAIGSIPFYTAYSASISGTNFTVSSPPAPVITYANNTNGVTVQTTLYSGQTGVVIYGVTITTNVTTTISNPLFYFLTNSSNPAGNFSSTQLVYSTSTSGPGTAVGAGAYPNCSYSQSGNDLIVSSSTSLTLNPGTYYNFYLVVTINTSTTSTFQVKFDELKSYSPAVDYYNTVAPNVSYTFTPASFSITGNNLAANGITQGAIAYSQTNIVLFGFSITGQGSYTVTQYQIGTSADPSSYFSNGKLYRSTDTHFSNATLVPGAVVNYNHGQNTIQITGVSDAFTGTSSTTYNYFVVGDFLAQTSYPSPATFTIGFSSSQALAALNAGTTSSYNNFTTSTSSFSIISSICWTGSAGTDFNDKLNYLTLQNGAVSSGPSSGVSVIIGDRTYTNNPIVGADITVGSLLLKNTQATSITINAGKELTVSNGITLFPGNSTTVTGGKLTLGSGSISTISSTATLTLGASTTVTNNGTLTLQSDATSSATIASIPSTSSIVGNVNVERWITGGAGTTYRGYRLLSSPVNISNSTTGTGNIDLGYINNTDNVNAIGALTGGPGGTNKGFSVAIATPAIYLYREDVVAGTSGTNAGKNKGVTTIYSTGISSSVDVATGTNLATIANFHIPVGNGYIFYNIGSTGQPSNATTAGAPASYAITAKGYLNQGTILFKNWYTGASTLSYTNTLPSNKGFNMVGNPYACTLDLNAFYNDNSAVIQPNIFVLNNINPGQAYISYNASTGLASDPHASQYIASGQGMFVQAKSASALTFKESQKASTHQLTGTQLLMGKPAKQAAISGFFMKVEQDTLINDYCGIYFDGDSDDFDTNDAVDLDGASPKVYMSSYTADGKRTGINSLSDYKNGKAIKLYVSATTDGLYKLKIEQIKNIDAIYDIWLKDNYKKDSLDLRSNNTYSFNVIRSDAASMGASRFEVVIRKKSLPQYQFVSLTGNATTTGVSLTWKTQNEYDFTGFTVEKLNASKEYDPLYYLQSDGSGTYSFIDKNPVMGVNTYRIKQDDIDNNITYSADVSVDTAKPNSQTSNIIVYPTRATSLINVKFANPIVGPANILVVNAMGDIVNKQVFTQQEDSIDISKLKTGVYFIHCTDVLSQKEIGLQRFIKL